MKNEVYIVTAYRWGDRSNHSYTVCVFNSKHMAIECANNHAIYRGGKYECVVEKCVINDFNNEYDRYTTEIYRTDNETT